MSESALNSPDKHITLNQTNALNITTRVRKLFNNGSLWHKIIIHNVSKIDREIVLKNLLNAVHPLDLIPVNYKVEGSNVHFIARNCGATLEKLCRDNLIVSHSGGHPYILTVILAYSDITEMQLNVQQNIFQAIKQRHNPKIGLIDLDSFHNDSAISELIFCVLSQPKILQFVLQLCKSLQPKILKLANNELRSLSPLDCFRTSKTLVYLDLRNNFIENMVTLMPLKSLQIRELSLDGNPVCQNYDEAGYVQAIKELCPSLRKLDGVLLGPEGFLAYRRNFLVTPNAESFIDQFLDHFFTLYDSADRACLFGLYHPKAMFTLSSCYISGQVTSHNTRLDAYKRYTRNILKLSDFSRTTEYLDVGPENIIKTFSSLPKTEHDSYTFTVDVLQYSKDVVMFTTTGAFREPVTNLSDTESMYCFSRTFVLVAGVNGEYNVINEMLHITNATTLLASRAFKLVRVPQLVDSRLRKAKNDAEKNDFALALSQVTALNSNWAKRCLEEAQWDFKNALEIFVDFYKLDKIPDDAFNP